MAWPFSQDYNEALQNPHSSFSDPELRRGRVVTNTFGIPQPCSGNFADVYAVECPAGLTKWAVKCFTREVHGRCERYREIGKHLQQARLPFTVDFQYLKQGICIAGHWYPILKMHRVEGHPLNVFVRDNLDKPSRLDALERVWLRMARHLRKANVAHCDLQHGNVLLVPDGTGRSLEVKLIDYDGMWVPTLANTPSGEVGHPAYQHPQRLRKDVYGLESDRFPLLVISCALRGLIAGGRQLWDRFDTGDNLLFRQQDFEAPTRSPLFAELLRMPHPEVRNLATILIDAVRIPLDQKAQLLEELLPNNGGPSMVAAKPKDQVTTPAERTESPWWLKVPADIPHKSTSTPAETARSLARSNLSSFPRDWAALRVWAAAVRDDRHRTAAARQEANTLISILDVQDNMRQQHKQLAGELWESALKLAEKLAQSAAQI